MNETPTKRIAIVTGITGQDGSYLAELLLEKAYEVHGVLRDKKRLGNIAHIANQIHLHTIDASDFAQVCNLIEMIDPAEYYHLASPSFVPFSHERPLDACKAIALSTLAALEAIRRLGGKVRFMQAGSSEMFGNYTAAKINECTPHCPKNLYASAKVYAHNIVHNYRDHFGVFACNAILFNHESPRRGEEFVTRKISSSVAKIKMGIQRKLQLGDLSAARDWGFAGDFVQAFWSMLQVETPDDYVLGTGKLTSIEEFLTRAFQRVDLKWQEHVEINRDFLRKHDSKRLVADFSRAQSRLNWSPTTSLETLVGLMVDHDLAITDSLLNSSSNRKAA